MKKFLTIAAAAILALGMGSAAYAVECALDNVPASSLLFPFVQYDYEGGDQGSTTLFAITNVSADAQIVHITVWTDYSIAILDFNLTLTGYDVQTINIRDILDHGVLPSADNRANEWEDGTGNGNAGGSPWDDGPFSTYNELWSGALDPWFASVGLMDPYSTAGLDCDPATWVSSPINYRAENNGVIPELTLGVFEGYLNASQTATTGYRACNSWSTSVTFPEGTWFTNQEPRPAWMYITADVVGSCNKDLPDGDAANYFNSASGVALANVLMGDMLYLDTENNYSEAFNAVHLEAFPFYRNVSFYYRYHDGSANSYREPLPTAWGFRYMVDEAAQADTWIRAWKGSTFISQVADLGDDAFGYGVSTAGPSALYAESCIPYTYYAWDEDENVNSVGPGFIPPWSGVEDPDPIPVPNLFPLETQEVSAHEFFLVEDAGAEGEQYYGWMMVIWPGSNNDGNVFTDDVYQTWMGVKYAAFGTYTAGLEAAVLANYNCDSSQILPTLGIGMYYSE